MGIFAASGIPYRFTRGRSSMLLAILLLAQTTPQCTTMEAALPAPLAAWTTPGHGNPADLTKPVVLKSLTPADLAKIEAAPVKKVSMTELIAAVKQMPEAAQTGGAARIGFRIDTAGTYGVALDQAAWVDVAPNGGAALSSVKHGHGPDCSTIRKIVRFELEPGDYVLHLTKLTKPMVKVMLVRD
jgi:hypothetical protein